VAGVQAPNTYMFGRMMQSRYESYLYNPDITGPSQQYVQMDLFMPGERRVHYTRTSLGTDFGNAVLEATGTPGPFHKSTIHWGNNWVLTRRDGTVFTFGFAPVLREIRDRFGNRVMRARRPVEREIAQPDLHERVEGLLQRGEQRRHRRLVEAADPFGQVADLHRAGVSDVDAPDPRGAGGLVEPAAAALGTGGEGDRPVHERPDVRLAAPPGPWRGTTSGPGGAAPRRSC